MATKKRLRDIPKGSMAARARAASVRRRKPSDDAEPTKWVTRHRHVQSTGIGDSVVPEFRPIRGAQGPASLFDRINPTWALLGAAGAAAITLAIIQTRSAMPRTA